MSGINYDNTEGTGQATDDRAVQPAENSGNHSLS
jgi:hypothetical protein